MITISEDQALGRHLGAARMLAGLDQGGLAELAGVSASTVSNMERGRPGTPESIRAVRKALRNRGVNLTFGNNHAIVSICFVDKNAEDDD
jgi:transcriptional regulator with XRE-family HTH domain